jgi:hypothetical protein
VEETQELAVTNTGQPQVTEIEPIDDESVALEISVTAPANVTVDLTPIAD